MLVLSLLVFTQTTLADRSDSDWRALRDLSNLLAAEKRYADKYAARLKEKVKKVKNMDEFDEKCEQDPIDLGLVIDSSVSIRKNDYYTGLKFLSSFLDEYDIGSGRKQVRVAAVSFGWGVYTDDGFNMTTYKTKEQVQNHIRNMTFRQGGRTDTGAALEHMREVQMRNARSFATKLVVVLTDGDSQETRKTKEQALLTKDDNITVFAVGVGNRIKYQELLNIAGGVSDHVFQADSYDDLDEDIKKELTRKTCYLVPKPTTTTVPTTQAERECGLEYPSDINFVFSAAAMGLDETATVGSIITNIIRHEGLEEGFQYGVVSGDCPDEEGFLLDQYKSYDEIKKHLMRYDVNNLPALVTKANRERFTVLSGARENATKTAVIFVGRTKVDMTRLNSAIEEMFASGVRHVFISTPDPGLLGNLPRGVVVLSGTPFIQATDLVNRLCFKDRMFKEGVMPEYAADEYH